jgi:hypothetical protein
MKTRSQGEGVTKAFGGNKSEIAGYPVYLASSKRKSV